MEQAKTSMTFGGKLKEIRLLKGITQKELSTKIGVPQCAISSYESDKHIPSIYAAYDIACALGVTLNDLVSVRSDTE